MVSLLIFVLDVTEKNQSILSYINLKPQTARANIKSKKSFEQNKMKFNDV